MIYVTVSSGDTQISKMILAERSLRQRIKALQEIQALQERLPNARIRAISSKLARERGWSLRHV